MKTMTRFSTEEDKMSMTRTRSDRMKPAGARKIKHPGKFGLKTCEQPARENKDREALKQTENQNLEVNESVNETVEITVTEDMMEVVINGMDEDKDNVNMKHEATVHEPEILTPTNSLILSATNLKEEMKVQGDVKDISEENFKQGTQHKLI